MGLLSLEILEGERVHPVCAGEDVFLLVGSQKTNTIVMGISDLTALIFNSSFLFVGQVFILYNYCFTANK